MSPVIPRASARLAPPAASIRVLAALAAFGLSAGAQPPADTGVIVGSVHDSLLTRSPLAGAEVWLDGTTLAVRTDVEGRFRLSGVPVGTWRITFTHPTLDSLGIGVPIGTAVVTPSAPAVVALTTPSGPTVRTALCGASSGDTAGTGALVGRVGYEDGRRDDDPAAVPLRPATDAVVTAAWSAYSIGRTGLVRTERSSTGRADRFGVFRLCGVPSDVSLLVRAVTQEGAIAVDEVNLAGRPVGVRSLRLPTAALGAAPGGALTGRVRRPGGDPAGGATITVPALGLEVVADARGDFSIAGLPSGVHGVEARLVGFRGTRVRVPMGASRGAHVSLTLGGAVNVLAATTVRERRGPSALEGFERRRREGGGHFVGAEEIRARAPATLLDVLTGLPGLQVTTNERTGAGALPSIVVTRALGQFGAMAERCPPAIFLDGVRIAEVMASGTQIPLNHLPSPGEVHGIEVYSNLASAPAQFQVLGSGCGVIAVWTKRGAPR